MGATCVIIGQGTIAALCGEVMLEHGVEIVGMVTSEPELVAWAAEHRVPCHAPGKGMRTFLRHKPFDYLFSIVNPTILSEDVLSLAGKLAVNFHDGPLPRYAGVHATSWALINGARRHAVTWHEMTSGVDEGPILAQRWFDVAEGETAFSLNTRCYTEGAASFADLLPKLLAGDVSRQGQDQANRTYFGRHDRPDAVLDFRRSAESLRDLVAGLDFGPYPNPLALPKVWLGDDTAIVRSIQVEHTSSTRPPGTVIAAGDGELRVATATRDVVLRLDTTIHEVDALPEWPDGERRRALDLLNETAGNERYWLGRLREIAPPQIRADISAPPEALPAVMAFLTRLSPDPFDVALIDPWRVGEYPGELFAHAVPWRAPIDRNRTFADAVDAVRTSLDELRNRTTYARDLPLRHSLEITLPVTITISDGPVRFSVAGLADRFSLFSKGIEAGLPIGEIPVVGEAELDALLAASRATHRQAAGVCVHQLVESVAAASPDAVAVRTADGSISYGELNRRANRLAHSLLARGVEAETLIGLKVGRTLELVVGLLGILKSGAAYLPLDPRYPADRLDFMISDAGAETVLSTVDADGQPETNPDVPVSPSSLAYVIYTSGSTGTPKGCAVEHRHLATTLLAAKQELGFGPTDVFPSLASHSFDISLLELLLPLVSGGSTVLVDAERAPDLGYLIGRTRDATFFHAVPSLMAAWLDRVGTDDYPALRCLLVGGDAVPRQLLVDLAARFPTAEVVELYGPTEATIISTFYRASGGPRHDVAHCIGRRFDHTSAYLLDAAMQPVPDGTAGELYLGGTTIARGYLHREALTAQRFVEYAGERVYRTGDLARRLADGTLEFLGRVDNQVKVRGFRIELGEIESALTAHEQVDSAVVVARDGAAGPRLVAYFTSKAPWLPDLKPFLARTLPDHMIPAHIVRLARLPLNANNKIDRAALPAPELCTLHDGFVPARTPTEWQLCALWADLLDVPRVGIRDNFFALGGHSLLATRLATAIGARMHAELTVADIFAAPTVEALARHLVSRDPTCLTPAARQQDHATLSGPAATIPPAAELEQYPLSLAQQRIWLHEQVERDTPYYIIPPVVIRLDGPLDTPALRRTFDALVARHESLRMVFDPARPVQTVTPGTFRLELTDDLSIVRRFADEPFDLAGGAPLRAALVRLAPQTHVLVVSMHHIASDGTSFGVLIDELSALYRGETLPPLQIRYVDYAVWDRVQHHEVGYWTDVLAGLPTVHGIPLDRPRPRTQNHQGALVVRSLDRRDDLVRLAREHRTTLFTVLETAFAALLHRYSGATDIAIGTPVANREPAETANVVGCFVNTVVLRSDLSGAPSFTELLATTTSRVAGALAHASAPIEAVVGALNPARTTAHHPLFQVMFAFEDGRVPDFPGVQAALLDLDYGTAKFDLTLYVRDHAGTLTLIWEYATDLFDAETIERMAEAFEVLVAGILANPAERVALLPVPSDTRALPVNRNGEVDRPASAFPVEEAELESEVERELAAIWRSLPGMAGAIGAHTNFFDIGGHSLLAARLVAEIRARWRVDIGITAVFERQTLRALAEAIEESGERDGTAITRVTRTDSLPLSFAQQRFWLLDELSPNSRQHAIMLALRLDGVLSAEALEETFRRLIARHEILRTVYRNNDGQPRQIVRDHVDFRLPVVDVAEPDLDRAVRAEHDKPFDLTADPMIRATLLRLGERSHVLLLAVHHIASDGWSNGILYRDINAIYRSVAFGEHHPLEPMEIQYADYAAWERTCHDGAALDDQLGYWTKELTGIPALHGFPLDKPRPAALTHHGNVVRQTLDADLTGRLHALARSTDATLFMVLHAAFAGLVSRYSTETDIVIGTVLANREQREVSGVVGPFLNPVALRADLSGDPTFAELVGQSKRRALGAFEHQRLPFEPLIDALGLERSPAYPPLMQLMLILHNNDGDTIDLPGNHATRLPSERRQARLELTLDAVETGGELEICWEYRTDLFVPATIERAAANFEQLLRAAVSNPDTRVSRLPLLSDPERHTTLVEWNGPALQHPETLVHELFEEHAERCPAAVAVVDGDRTISYGELNALANRLAHKLIARGVRSGELVGVHLDRSIEMVAAYLGTLKAGAGYVPISRDLPPARVRAITVEAGLAYLVDPGEPFDGPAENPPAGRVSPGDVAYTIFTSGSTGRPKGVQVEHRAILSSFRAWEVLYHLNAGTSNHLQLAASGFDVCVGDMVRAMCSGGKLVICPKETLLDPPALHRLIEAEEIHCAEFVPLALRNLVDYLDAAGLELTTLRYLVAGSDVWHGEDLRKARRVVRPETIIVNSYGLTEAGVDSTCFVSTRDDPVPAGPVPIGTPLPNVRAYVLNPAQQLCPIGAVGELHIGGPALARGYLNDAELTGERFVTDPFSHDDPTSRMFRTGDLARWREDGQLELLGRVDAQVKIRGFRIELGEIGSCLLAHPAVTDAVVVDFTTPAGERLLAAYVVGCDDTDPLREYVAARLPDYMVPTAFVRLERLPTNANGKVDRTALPAPELDDAAAYVAPEAGTEHELAALWRELLGVASPSTRASFFSLGGHSLLAARLVALISERRRVKVPIRAVFEQPTIRQLARLIESGATGSDTRIERVDRDSMLRLSSAQSRLWVIDALEPGTPQYNIAAALRLDGRLDVVALEQALAAIVERHEVLRTTYRTIDGVTYQMVREPTGFELTTISGTEDELDGIARAAARLPFDLSTGPVFRATLVTLAPRRHVLILTMHHIAADGWSMGILANELTAGYTAIVRGVPNPLAPLTIQYADYAAWERDRLSAEALDAHRRYWLERLDGLPAVHGLPLDRPRPARQTYRGATHTVTLDASTLEALRALAGEHDTTLFTVLQAAFAGLLARYSDETDIVIGTPVANRDRAELAPLVGFFVNTVVLRTDLTGDPTFADLLEQGRREVLGALEHQAFPFDRLVDELSPDRSLSHHPVFQILLVLQNNDRGTFDLPELSASVFKPDTGTAKFDLTLDVLELPEQLRLSWEYATDLFGPATIRRMAAHFERLLAAILRDPTSRLSELSLVDDADQRMLAEWNATGRDYDRDHLVHSYVAEQPPERPAVSAYGVELSYGELERRGNRLARALIAAGVGPEVVVGLFLPRDQVDLVVGVLAVFKAGGAYVAIDLDAPGARIEHILRDASVSTVLTTSSLADRLPGRSLCVDTMDLSEYSDEPIERRVTPESLAYLIYTSGTTGQPKALLQTHRTLENLVSMPPAPEVLSERMTMLQYAALSFDVSIQELATAWKTGSELVLISADDRVDPVAVLDLIESRRVGRLFVPTAMLYLLADEYVLGRKRDLACLREIIVGGEALKITANIAALVEDNAIRFVNEYGPSETHAASYEIIDEPSIGSLPPVGRPVGNLRLYIVDRHGQRQPVGLPGELYIGGDGVARGYLNQPALTAERFIEYAGERVYRSGDRVRYLPDGKLEYLGRMDHQVKIRGYRIELGEIEQLLKGHPGIRDAVVVADTDRQALVAYVVPAETVTPERLREYLRGLVPEYQVPAAFVPLDALPLTRVGKIDRRRLPAPDLAPAGGVAPRTPTERALLPIWQQVLGTEGIGVQDSFFALGGHSLLAVRLVSKITSGLGRPVPLRSIVECPTIAELARHIDGNSTSHRPVGPLLEDPASAYEPFPLTDIQQAYQLGRGDHFDLGNIGTHSYIEMPADGLDVERLQWAWNQLIDRHPMLRMVLTPDGRQRILEHVGEYVFAVHDGDDRLAIRERMSHQVFAVHDGDDRLAIRERMSHQVFSGYDWPLFEICVSQESATRSKLHMSIDAFSLDAASYLLLFREWLHLYDHPDQPLRPLTITFRDYVLSERRLRASGFADPSRSYWLDRLAGFPSAPDLPCAIDPSEISAPFFEGRRHFVAPPRWQRLKELAARLRVTPTVLVIGCFSEILARWSRSPHFALNLTLFNRIEFHEQVHELVGDFTSLTLLEIDYRDPDASLADRLTAVQSRLFADIEHRHFTGVEVQRELSRQHSGPVTFPVVVTSILGLGDPTGVDGPFERNETYAVSQTSQVWLDFQVSEVDGALSCNWDSVRGLFPDQMLDDMFASFTSLLERLADDADLVSESRVDTVPPAQRALVHKVNATEVDLTPPHPALLHQPLLDQIRSRGDKTAVATSGRRVSYRELGLASQRLARHIRPGRPVAVLMRKGWEQVVAVLAVLRAGAAYLPIDAALPAERIRTLLGIGEVEQILTTPDIDCELPAIVVDESLLADGALEFDTPRSRPTDLAYLIFTSGSTGTPKGVMIDHRGALNTVLDVNARYRVTAGDTVLGLSSLSFDLSVYDIFGVLGAGGTLVLPQPDDTRDPEAWLRYLHEYQVNVWNTVPALLGMLVDIEPGRLPLRLVMLSGDWIPTDLPDRIAALAPDARLISLGGATEASIWSIDYPIETVDTTWRSIPYGKPMANQQFYVLKKDLDLAPVYTVGDLYIGGVGVALGYWRDAEKTARSFVTHPVTGARLYRTGDLGRLLPDGNIEFLGRDDEQVKIQGHRIELGEIEARLAEHPGVREAVVATHDTGRTKQLVAHVVPTATDAELHGAVITDETERTVFTLRRKGIRSDLGSRAVTLPHWPAAPRTPGAALPGPMRLEQVAELLAAMAEQSVPRPKRLYPSAGGLYPVQVYLSARAVDGLAPGSYYYQPATHSLVPTSAALVDGDGAATLYLVADIAAIEPMYGRNSDDFARLEAGHMAYLLERCGAAPLPVGVDDLGTAFQLGDTHRPLAAFSVSRTESSGGTELSTTTRKSYRAFRDAAVSERTLLAVLCEDPALRVLVWRRAGGWSELDGGRLVPRGDMSDAATVFRHSWDIFATATFGVLLVGARTDDALHRAGALGQAMMIAAGTEHIGLCPIGAVDGAVYAFLGGMVSDVQINSTDVSSPADDLPHSVQRFLSGVLPPYMVPAHVLRIDQIPLSANGKVNRQALPAPEAAASAGAHVVPESQTEKALAAIWQDVLGSANVGRTDNFFDLGGDSMHAISVLTRAKREGIRFTVRDLYTHQTIERLAGVATFAADSNEEPIAPFALLSAEQRAEIDLDRVRDAYPLTALQQGMIFHNLVDGERGTYHEVISTHLRLPWDPARFRAALRTVTARHDILRTVFRGELQLVLHDVEPELSVVDLRHLDAAAQAGHIREWIAEERRRPFDPDRPPWLVVIHLRGADDLQYSLVCHHALLDGWSVARFDTELFTTYQGSPELKAPMPYRRFVAAELEARESVQARDHWTATLVDAPLPWWTGATRGEQRRRSMEIRGDSYDRLRALARSLDVSDTTVFLAAHLALVSLLSGSPDVVTSVVTNCRPETDGAEHALGLFLNSLPCRVDRRGRTWAELIRAIAAKQLENDRFKTYPLANIQEDTGLDLAGSLFTYVNFQVAGTAPTLGDDSVDTTNYLLATEVARNDAAEAFRVVLVADDGAFDEAFIERIAGYYRNILDSILHGSPDQTIDNAHLIGETEVRRLLDEWNDTATPFADDVCMHELFEVAAAKNPDSVALVLDGETMTYAELNAKANRVAHQLIAMGVRPDELVGLAVQRSFAMLVGIYGIWKAGAAYVPLDPAYPAARLRTMSHDVVTVLTEQDLRGDYAGYPDTNPGRRASATHLAYVIYTSGSTGSPKGVMITHRALVNRIDWMQREYRLMPHDVVLHKTPYSFDVSVWELTWPLITGARLVIARPDGHKDPDYLINLIRTEWVTTIHFVPSMLRVLIDYGRWADCTSVRQVFCSGEALSPALQAMFFATGTRAALHNLYGPTEAAVDVSHWACTPGDDAVDRVPIGRPINNIQLYVLDPDRQLLPAGVPGELYIGGIGLARGYLNRPDLTDERFISTPFAGRLYRTGDLVRQRPDGVIEFLGRMDHQVKIRGFRIELGEIETVLIGHPMVTDAVVIARDGQLLAYVVCPDDVDLRPHLTEYLPDFMMPTSIIHLERIPLNANGKLDRAGLPEPGATPAYTSPRDPVEAQLCEIVSALLGIDGVGVSDSFLELGGDSLKLIRLSVQIRRRLGVDVPVMALFSAPTIGQIAALVRDGQVAEGIVHRLTPPRPGATITVLCVPYAAGDGIVYQSLAEQVDQDVAVFSITNPRTFDPADSTQLNHFLEQTVAEIRQQIRGPVILWGHCVGYALALLLAQRVPDVRAVYLGGVTIDSDEAESHLTEAAPDRSEIIQRLTAAGLGELQGSITEAEWDLVAEKFRHDLTLSQHCHQEYFGRPLAKLPMPVYCVIATDDPLTQDWHENAKNWAVVSDDMHIIELDHGGHYFVNTRSRHVAELVRGNTGSFPD